MKKKIIGIVLVAAIAMAAGWNVMQNENEVVVSDLALSNVEALASGEGGGSVCSGCKLNATNICWMTELDGCLGTRTGTSV